MTDFDRTDNQHRPALGATHVLSAKPLIVTPTFVSRVDDMPRGERPQDSGSAKNRCGHEVHFPSWRAGALALEGNPDIAFEHWDEYWRKVHVPKLAWDEPGSSSAKVLRYDQVHRISSGPSSSRTLSRAMIATPYPAFANRSAVASPISALPPVTTAMPAVVDPRLVAIDGRTCRHLVAGKPGRSRPLGAATRRSTMR